MTRPERVMEAIGRRPRSAQVTERLREGVLAGLCRRGEQLAGAGLARRFRVGRGPLREAVQRLMRDGLLQDRRPHRGVLVTGLTDDAPGARRALGEPLPEPLEHLVCRHRVPAPPPRRPE